MKHSHECEQSEVMGVLKGLKTLSISQKFIALMKCFPLLLGKN